MGNVQLAYLAAVLTALVLTAGWWWKKKKSTVEPKDDEDWNRVVQRIVNHESKTIHYNKKIIETIAQKFPTAMRDFEQLTKGVVVVGKIEMVKYPDGKFQKDKCNDTFYKVYVQYIRTDKRNYIFYGYLYAQHTGSSLWMKIPFES